MAQSEQIESPDPAQAPWGGRGSRTGDPGDQHNSALPGGPDFHRMIKALTLVQDRIATAAASDDVVSRAALVLENLAADLAPYAVPERQQITGHRLDLPGRGQALVPAFHIDEWDDKHATGRFTLGRYYLGGNGAAHGGVIPLVFDEVLGRLANTGRPIARTAYLHVNYRSITPIGPELRLEARIDREEGRKRFLTASMYEGDRLTADAEGLFVALRPGQP